MRRILLPIILILLTFKAIAQPLPKNSNEVKQLIAMGYEIQPPAKDDEYTIASNGENNITVTRSKARLVIARYYTRKNLNESDEFELLKIVNELNQTFYYQVSVWDTTLAVALYDYADYNSKTFLKMVRDIEKSDTIFEYRPKLIELLND
jgi:hypothetical protein